MFEAEMEAAAELARYAGRILMDIYAKDFAVAYKGKNDPVTEADKLANAYLVDALRKRFPSDGVVAEETEDQSDARKAGRCWYVDPVDGTKEFIAKNGEFSVMLGLAIDGDAQVGVVYQPSKDKLYRGIVGQGAYLEEAGATRQNLALYCVVGNRVQIGREAIGITTVGKYGVRKEPDVITAPKLTNRPLELLILQRVHFL